MDRRNFLAGTIGAGTILPTAVEAAANGTQTAPTAPEGAGLTYYQLGPQIWVRWNNELLTCYRAHPSQKYPYFYPTTGPVSGRSLTSESSLPYPHHRSLFFGCDRVNGANYWQEGYDVGQIFSSGPKVGKCTGESLEILDRCEWKHPSNPVDMRDERTITIQVKGTALRIIDVHIRWTAVRNVVIEKTNHSLFSLRAASDVVPTGGGQLVNSGGKSGEKETAGMKAAWCSFYGRRAGISGSEVEGITLMDHPRNPWAPTPWFTRDYGFMSPTPFNYLTEPWKLPAGDSVELRYRLVLHAGDPKKAGIPDIYASWIS